MLGYDIEVADARTAPPTWLRRGAPSAPIPSSPPPSTDVLVAFADLRALFRPVRDEADADVQVRAPQEYLHAYLRSLDVEGEGLPAPFLAALRRALGHYGVDDLERTPELEEALYWIHQSQQRVDAQIPVVVDILERWLEQGPQGDPIDDGRRRTLDAWSPPPSAATRSSPIWPARSASASSTNRCCGQPATRCTRRWRSTSPPSWPTRQARSATATSPRSSTARNHSPRCCCAAGRRPAGHPSGRARDDDPPVLPAPRSPRRAPAHRRWTRRRGRSDEPSRRRSDARDHHRRRRRPSWRPPPTPVVAARGCRPASRHLRGVHVGGRQRHDRSALSSAALAETLAPALAASPERVVVAIGGTGPAHHVSSVRHLTFVPGPEATLVEDDSFHGLHPLMVERLHLWRLANFAVERLPGCRGRLPRPRRRPRQPQGPALLALGEVRDLTPVRDDDGRIVALPQLERVLLEALEGMRRVQARLPPERRYQWNRVLLYVWPPLDLTIDEIERVARSLAPATEGLGIEEVGVHCLRPDPATGELRERLIRLDNPTGTGFVVVEDDLPTEPLLPLDEYTQKVVQSRAVERRTRTSW